MGKLKTTEELLHDLKKANQVRKEYLANRAGFQSVEDYKKHLETSSSETYVTRKSNMFKKSKETVHIVNLLDRSGSMGGIKLENAVAGINAEIDKFKKENNINYNFSLITFDDNIKTEYFNKPVKTVGYFRGYAGGTTALYGAIGETLSKLKGMKDSQRVLVNIFTDGGENASVGTYKSAESIKNLIKECEKLGFTITFIGTEFDVQEVNRRINIDLSNTLVHDNTGAGVEQAFRSKMSATLSYSASVSRGVAQEELTKGFYSKKTGKL